MANSFLPTTEDESGTIIASSDTQVLAEASEETYSTPPVEEPLESEHFLEEDETLPEDEVLEDDTPSITPQTVAQDIPTLVNNPVKPIPNHRDPITLQIEKILESDLADVFTALTTVQKQQFKIKGEETAHKIRQMLSKSKVKLGKIIELIFDWLKILPGINRFFLEQEAKIKANKIIALREQPSSIF
jgi:hypothetical protein